MNNKRTYWKISELKNWEKNPRNISKDGFDRLKYQIKKLGQYKPLIITPEGTVLGGNMRLRAYRDLGMKKAWVSIVEPKNESEEMEYALSDNDRAGYYDTDLLANAVPNLEIDWEQYSVDLREPIQMSTLMEDFRAIEEDTPPDFDKDATPISQLGTVYKLGDHRLMCGDSTDEKAVETLMNGKEAKLIFTSPPYNMNADMYKNYDDNMRSDEYIKFNVDVVNLWKRWLRGYVFWNISYNKNARWEFIEIMYRLVKETKMRFLELIVWDKGHALPVVSKDMLTRRYEDILLLGDDEQAQQDIEFYYLAGTEKRANFYKGKAVGTTNYWRIGTNKTQISELLACYPVNVPARGIMMVSDVGDIVMDPFVGSGTTIIAAEQTDRICYAMEYDPLYTDYARKRYALYTNQWDGEDDISWQKATPKV